MSSPVFSVALSWQAWHETGHVFAAEALGVAVRSVRIGRPHEGGATDVGSVGPRQRLLIALGAVGPNAGDGRSTARRIIWKPACRGCSRLAMYGTAR